MKTILVILAIYWVVSVAAVYAIRAYNNNKNRFKIAVFEAFEIVKTPSLCKRIGTHTSIVFSGAAFDACHHHRFPN